MQPVLFLSADPGPPARLTQPLDDAELAWTACSSWDEVTESLLSGAVRVLFVDARFPGTSGPMLSALAKRLPHAPAMRAVGGTIQGIPALEDDAELLRLATRAHQPGLTVRERYLLELSGMGREAARQLQSLVATQAPLLFWGERGTGKEWVARVAHRLAGQHGPFEIVRAGAPATVHRVPGGALYLDEVEQHDPSAVLGALDLARASGWRVFAGTRRAPAAALTAEPWAVVHLRPLRERPGDLRPLARLYLDAYVAQLALGPKRFDADLWSHLSAHRWPGNQRELEAFVVRALTSAQQPTVSWGRLPPSVQALLDPSLQAQAATQGFEHLVEDHLRPLVERYHADGAPIALHRLVIDATERALVRVALQVAGNQKAAATLLGVARNTLRERVARLDPEGEPS